MNFRQGIIYIWRGAILLTETSAQYLLTASFQMDENLGFTLSTKQRATNQTRGWGADTTHGLHKHNKNQVLSILAYLLCYTFHFFF
jgi:hypothetical protein